MQCRQIVGAMVALGLLTSGLTFAQQPDRRVAVVAQGAPLRADDKVVGRVARGQIFVVRSSRGQWWNVGTGAPRWIHKRHALPLDRALEHFNKTIQQDPRASLANELAVWSAINWHDSTITNDVTC